MDTLGKRIRAARLRRGWGQADLLQYLSVKSTQSVSYWENDRNEPGTEDLAALAAALGVSVDWLLAKPKDQSLDISAEDIEPVGTVVPSIDLNDVPKFVSGDKSVVNGRVRSHFPCGKGAFRTFVKDRANDPVMVPGDSIIVDPSAEPEADEWCLANVDGVVVIRRIKKRGDTFILEPLVDRFDTFTVERKAIVGKITEVSRPLK